ncbi:hypothetical protein C2G38_2028450 [Gigaspora rosea]|uniref:Uncharacterized protein n=1 Tax=Gigaspora rosea TaxID=44941 RepID=A0A397W8A4_9GLOM|nr:hypothetical protein C2G38_2028450 [Gigaspora rosea]
MAGYFDETSHEDWSLDECPGNRLKIRAIFASFEGNKRERDYSTGTEKKSRNCTACRNKVKKFARAYQIHLTTVDRKQKESTPNKDEESIPAENFFIMNFKRHACSDSENETEKVDDDSGLEEIINFKDFSLWINTCNGKRWCLNNGENLCNPGNWLKSKNLQEHIVIVANFHKNIANDLTTVDRKRKESTPNKDEELTPAEV